MPQHNSPLESSLKKAVLKHLATIRRGDQTLAFRKRHGSAMTLAGDPDITGLWRGVHFEIELKREGESPTLLQTARAREWTQAGAKYAVVRSLDDLYAFLLDIAPRT